MRVGIAIQETWSFFREIHAYLAQQHQTELFTPRSVNAPILGGHINRRLFQKDLRSFLQRNDVVFFEWASQLLYEAAKLPKTCGIVARLHRYEMYAWASRIHWDAVDRLIVVSQAKYDEFVALCPDHAAKVVIIPEAVSVERFQPKPKVFAGDIGILCHMKPRKRVYELVLAFHELLAGGGTFHLHIGGGRIEGFGEYYDSVQQLVKRLGLADKVTFYGRVTKAEEWYPLIDICISNGYSEGLQVSPLEAMASGCFCLSHHWDGAEELLPDAQLYYTNTELIGLIRGYAALEPARKEQVKAGMRRMVCDRFNVDQTKLEVARLVEEVGRQHGAG